MEKENLKFYAKIAVEAIKIIILITVFIVLIAWMGSLKKCSSETSTVLEEMNKYNTTIVVGDNFISVSDGTNQCLIYADSSNLVLCKSNALITRVKDLKMGMDGEKLKKILVKP